MNANGIKFIRKIDKRTKSNFKFSSFQIGTLILFIVALTTQSCKQGNEQGAKPAATTPLVKVQPAMKIKMVSFIEITGTIQANVFTDIKSPADGIIESLYARENQRVEKDRIIALINPNDRVALISNNQLQVQQPIKNRMITAYCCRNLKRPKRIWNTLQRCIRLFPSSAP